MTSKGRKAFLCYEKNNRGGFSPSIVYDELTKSTQGKENNRNYVATFDVSHHVDPDTQEVSFSFASLQVMYPPEKPLINDRTNPKEKERRQEMARPVSGYLSSTGQFFDTVEEAEFFDASFELQHKLLSHALLQTSDMTPEHFMEILTDIQPELVDYVTTKKRLEALNEPAGQPADDSEDDDTRVRDEDSPELVETADAEAVAS